MARRRFYVDEIRHGAAELAGEDARHLAQVLRAEVGQRYEISDHRSAYLAEIREIHRGRVLFAVVEPLPPRAAALEAVVCAALFKFDRFEWMVEKLTELGVAAIVPVVAARSEKGLGEAALKRMDRWTRIAREAGQQARRDGLPEIHPPVSLKVCLGEQASRRYFLDELPGAAPLPAVVPSAVERSASDRVALLGGPEGGWTAAEREMAVSAGWTPVSLGPQILRSETAVLAGLSVLACTWWAGASG